MAFGCTITVATGKIPSSQGNFIWLATTSNFPTASKDGGANSILNGGGNLRCYTDSGKATRLAVDVVSFVTGVTPVIQVWGLSPTLDVASTVYIEADAVETTQPAVGAAFGRNAVHAGLENTFHLNETANNTVAGYVDSTGNSSGTGFNMATNSAIQIGDGQDFASNTKIHSGTNPVSLSDAFSIEVWIKTTAAVRGDIYSEGDANLASRYSRLSVNEASGTQDNVSFTARGDDGTGVATSADINITDGLPHKIVVNEYSRASREIFVDNVSVATDLTARGAATGLDIQTIGCLRRTSDALFYSGAAEQLITTTVIKSADKRTAEYNNQSDASTFWSTSAWVDSGGGGETLSIDSGAYNLSGTTVALKAEFNTAALSGSYSLTGTNANLIAARSILSESGTYNLTGSNVTLVYTPGGGGESLTIDSGTFNLTGSDVALIAVRYIQADSGNYTLTGESVSLSYASNLVANSGSYALTGDNVNLFANRGIIADNGSYTLSGASVVLRYSGDTSQTIGTVTTSFAVDKYTAQYKPNSITVNFKD